MRLQSENTKHADQVYDIRNLCQTQVSPSWSRTCARPLSPAPSRCHTGNEQRQPEACRQMAQRPMNVRRKAMETCTHTCTRSSIAIRRTTLSMPRRKAVVVTLNTSGMSDVCGATNNGITSAFCSTGAAFMIGKPAVPPGAATHSLGRCQCLCQSAPAGLFVPPAYNAK